MYIKARFIKMNSFADCTHGLIYGKYRDVLSGARLVTPPEVAL